MPIDISGSNGKTVISGSNTTIDGADGSKTVVSGSDIIISGSSGETTYGSSEMSSSGGTILSSSAWPILATGSYASPKYGATTVVKSGNCMKMYVFLSGSGGDEWVFMTGSTGCTGSG